MGSTQGRPSQPANAVKELRDEKHRNDSPRATSVKPNQAASDVATEPRDSDVTTERCRSASDAALRPCPSAPAATIEACPNATDANVASCPSGTDSTTELSPSAADSVIASSPSDSDATAESCPSAQDAAKEANATDVAKASCPSVLESTIDPNAPVVTTAPSVSDAVLGACPSASGAATGALQLPASDPERANRRRWAKVRLYTHALCGMGVAGAAASLSLPMILHCVSSQLLKHWCLIVRFLDEQDRDRIWLCDFGNALSFKLASAGTWHPRKGERINYMARPVSKQELRKGKMMERKFYLGTIQISENELKAVCSSMRYNGRKYHPLMRNCQDCSKDLCRRLGLSSSIASDHLIVFLCPQVALITELAGSAYNAANKFAASKSNKEQKQEEKKESK